MLKQYPTEVKLVFKNFPLRQHKEAGPAAQAALAANKQGKFWEMHDLIFENYNKLNNQMFKDFAGKIGLDLEKFNADFNSEEVKKQIQADLRLAFASGVRSTPTIFVNGRKLKNRSVAGFKNAIDAQLKKNDKSPKVTD